MNEEFVMIGKKVKAQSGAYADLPDEVVGQAYLKKTNPLQYELYKNQVEISKTRQESDIQAEKELDVNAEKLKQEYKFKQEHPEPLTPSEKLAEEESIGKKEAAVKTKQSALSLVDDLLSRDTGAITGARNPLKYLTKEAQYTEALLDQLRAKMSLESRGLLKGTGTITDIEVKMLEDSIAALAKTPDTKNPKNGKIKAGKYQLRNEDLKKELLRIKEALSGEKQDVDISENPMSAGGFVENASKDAGSVLQGILGIPSYLMEKGKESQETMQDPNASLLDKYKASSPLGILLDTGKGISQEYGDLAKDPVGHAYNKPVSTLLDILPFLKGAQSLKTGRTAKVAGKTTQTASEVSQITKAATGIEDATTVSKVSTAIQDIAPKINKVFDKAKGAAPRTFLTKAKVDAYKLYDGVPIDTSSILNSADEFVKRYPSSAATLEKYRPAIESANTVEKLDKALGEWSDAFKTNKDIKPGINNDLLGTIWKAGRQELSTKAPKVAAVKTLMGEMIDVTQAGNKALWKGVLAKLLFGK